MKLTKESKEELTNIVNDLHTEGCTDIYGALKLSCDVASKHKDQFNFGMLLTDGCPTNEPPEKTAPAFAKLMKDFTECM